LPQEQEAIANRLAAAKAAMNKTLGIIVPVNQVPKIAVLLSGGGYRAMFAALGFMIGLEKIGLLDCVSYVSSLSGGAWFLGSYMDAKIKQPNLSVEQFKNDFLLRVTGKGLIDKPLSPAVLRNIANALAVELSFNRDVSLVDVYGCLLANRLLAGDDKQMRYTSTQASIVKTGAVPIPMYATVSGETGLKSSLQWYTLTPFDFGSSQLGWIPTFAVGRLFKNGVSIDEGVERSLGLSLGDTGSAFAINYQDFAEELVKMKISTGVSAVDAFIQEQVVPHLVSPQMVNGAGGERFTVGKIFNYTVGMPHSRVQQARLGRVDGGLAFNLPYPSVSGERPEHKADILIILDASATLPGAPALKACQDYAAAHGLSFPAIDYNAIETRSISIFQSLGAPMVIYMPRINDSSLTYLLDQPTYAAYAPYVKGFNIERCTKEGFCNKTNFEYTEAQAKSVLLLTEFNVVANQAPLVSAIQAFVNQG
jgi:phospholipase A2